MSVSSWDHNNNKPAAAGLLLWARRAGGIDRLLHSRSVVTANAVNAMLSVCVVAEHRVTCNVFDIGKFTACVKGAAALSTRGPVVYEGRMKPGH